MKNRVETDVTDSSGKSGTTEYAFGRWVVRQRWPVLIFWLVATVVLAMGAQKLTNNPDNRVFFSSDNPHLLALERLENTYNRNDNLLFVLAPKGRDVFAADVLEAVHWLTEESWQIPFSSRVDSITNYQHMRADGDDLIVEDLVADPLALTPETIEATRDIALTRPVLVNRLVSPDSAVTAVSVLTIKPPKATTEVLEIVAYARELANKFRARYPDIDVYMTGGVMFDAAFTEVPEVDLATLFPIMVVLIILILAISLRMIMGTVVTVMVVVMTVAITMGLAGWLLVVLNAGTMSAPVIILTLSVAHSVHILVTIRQEMSRGAGRHDAIVESLRINMSPIFITSVTTAIGFLSMNFSDAPPFRLLGNIVATGVMVAFALSVTFLPAMIAVLPIRVRRRELTSRRFMERLADFVVRARTGLLFATVVAVALSAVGINRIILDDDFVKYFDPRFDIRVHSDFTEDNLTGINAIEFSVPSGEEGGINDPVFLAKLEEFAIWLRSQPKVAHVSTLTNVIKQLNMSMHGDDKTFYRVPENRELTAQYLLVYEMSLPYGLDLNDQINVAKSATRVTALLSHMSSREMRDLNDRAQVWLRENMPDLQTPGTGLSLIFAHISDRNINSMLFGSLLALALISGVLILALRSFRIGVLSLVPNLFPAMIAFGIWGFIAGQVGLAVAVVVAMTLGIVVDDTVHFLSKYLRARREHGFAAAAAVRYAFSTVGMALWITSVTLVAGFLVLAFSGFRVNAEMGLLSAITIAVALVADFLFLPALLMMIDSAKKVADEPAPAE